MPVVNSGQSQPAKNTHINPLQKYGRRKVAVITGLLLVIIGLTTLFVLGRVSAENDMKNYLHEKYGKEFVVENYRIAGAGLGVEGDPTMDAYPVDDPSLEFEVWDIGMYAMGQHIYSDNFAGKYWSKQGAKLLNKDVKAKISDIDRVTFSAHGGLDGIFISMDTYPYKGSIPSVLDVLKEYPDKLRLSLGVHSAILSEDQEPSVGQLVKAYEVMEFAKDVGITNGTITYTYTHPDYDKINSRGGRVPRYVIAVDASELGVIERPDQLISYFEDRLADDKGGIDESAMY